MSTTGMPTTPTFYEGVLQVVSGVSDLFLLYDAPDCIVEQTESVCVQHDLLSRLTDPDGRSRASSTHLLDSDLVLGTTDRLRAGILEIAGRSRVGMLLLGQSSLPHISGTDAEAIACELGEDVGIAIGAVRSAPVSGGHVDGFRNATEAIARHLPLKEPAGEPAGVAIVGYPLSRLEEDDLANVAELERICEGIGVPVRSFWFDGGTVANLSEAANAAFVVSLPWGGEAARILGRRIGRPVIEAGVPVGLDGTVQWVQKLARAVGREAEAEAFIDRELDRAVALLEWAVPRGLMHRNVAIDADPFLAAALVGCLAEPGVQIRSVNVLARAEADAEPVLRALEAAGQTAVVRVDSPFGALEALWAEQAGRGELDLVIGTSTVRDAVPRGIPCLELGYPSFIRHALYPAPWWGFRGTLWLLDAVYNAIAASRYPG